MAKINVNSYRFKKDHILYSEGYPIKGKSIFLIRKGYVEIGYKLKNDKVLKIVIPEGGFFGIFEALGELEYRITEAKTVEESEISIWDKDDFITASSMNPELGLKSIVFLSTYLRTLNHKIQELG